MNNQVEFKTAQQALDYIEVQRAIGLTPVMIGTSFYRHSFQASQFGSYIEYLDERGTRGCCQPRNLLRTFEFKNLGQPVPGMYPDQTIEPARGYGLVIATISPEPRRLTLLEAAEAAVRVLPAGPEREDLEAAIAAERRIH